MEQADEATDWEPLLALSGHSIEIDPFDGDAAYYRLRALLGLDQQPKALEYYNQLQNLYYRERGEKLPERVRRSAAMHPPQPRCSPRSWQSVRMYVPFEQRMRSIWSAPHRSR